MKTFKVIPLVLAGFCGYLHTTINRRFHAVGDLMSNHPPNSLMDMPHSSTGRATASSMRSESSSVTSSIPSRRNLDVRLMNGPAEDLTEAGKDLSTVGWSPPPEDRRVLAQSAAYQKELLQYTVNLLPKYRDPSSNAPAAATKDDEDELSSPKAYEYNQIDIIVPASGQDDRLQLFAQRLGLALTSFNSWYENERRPAIVRRVKQEEDSEVKINDTDGEDGNSKQSDLKKPSSASNDNDKNLDLTFRLLVTRYPLDDQKTEADFEALQKELSEMTTLPVDKIEIVRVGHDAPDVDTFPLKFNRANARNNLHMNACHIASCIVTAMDVDMQVLPIYFHRALKNVKPLTQAYFPIVFSEFNPDTVQLVQDFVLTNKNTSDGEDEDDGSHVLPPFSMHRGLWRDFGYGMYALAGSDANRFRFNEQYQGWGHEDNDFYKLVHGKMKVHRQREEGLIHGWHPKDCSIGKDIITKEQWVDCLNSLDIMEGDPLGLLLRAPLPSRNPDDFPKIPTEAPDQKSIVTTKTIQKTKSEDGDDKDKNDNDEEDNEKEDKPEDLENETDNSPNENESEADQQSEQQQDEEGGNSQPTEEEAEGTEDRVTTFQKSGKLDKERRLDGSDASNVVASTWPPAISF